MHVYASPRRGYCASCDGLITDRPVYRMDEAYCCTGCAVGGPCVCSYEADLADDGVDGLGLPFALDAGTPALDEALVPVRRLDPARADPSRAERTDHEPSHERTGARVAG